MAKKKFSRRKFKLQIIKVKTNCEFCKGGYEPDYKNYKDLAKFLSDRARILSKDRTGVCSKHQKRLSVQIKRARHLALLPFVREL